MWSATSTVLRNGLWAIFWNRFSSYELLFIFLQMLTETSTLTSYTFLVFQAKFLEALTDVTLRTVCCQDPSCKTKLVISPKKFLISHLSLYKAASSYLHSHFIYPSFPEACSSRCFPSLLTNVSRSLHWPQLSMTHPRSVLALCVSVCWLCSSVCVDFPDRCRCLYQ